MTRPPSGSTYPCSENHSRAVAPAATAGDCPQRPESMIATQKAYALWFIMRANPMRSALRSIYTPGPRGLDGESVCELRGFNVPCDFPEWRVPAGRRREGLGHGPWVSVL